jgi:murein DD-endopeptidase MepM/ murein hydrolase activator NlpD
MDSSKFFNRKINVRDPKTPYQKGKVVEESKNYSSRVFSRVKETSTTKSLLSIRRKVFQIENSLQNIFNLNKKSDKVKQRFAVVELEEERNNKKLSSPATGLGNLIQRPKTGAMDMIKNFVTFTFLGWLFTTLQPLIGKLEWVFPLLKGAFDFIGGTVKFLVESLGSFIKFGYDAKDKFDEIAGNIKKETKGVDKHFDNVLNELKSVFSGAVEVVNSFLDISVDAEELKNARNELNEDSFDVAEIPLPLAPDFSQLTQVSPSIASASNINGGMLDNDQTGNSNENSSSASVTSPTIEAAATGGHIGQQGRIDPRTPITRGISSSQRRDVKQPKPNIQSQKTTPGKDVGGEAKVKEVYGEKEGAFKFDFIPLPSFFRTDKKSGYNALISASEEYKKPKSDDILGIGNLMGAAIDTSLGQKPEKKTYTQFADGLKYLVDYGMTNPEEFNKLDLEQMVRNIVEPKVEIAINKIREEINKKSSTEPGGGGPGGGGFGGGMGDSIESIDMGGFSAEDIDALGRMIAAESAGESSIGKAGVLAVILNRYRLIKSGAASPGAFNVTGKTKEQVTIRDVLFAGGTGSGNQFSPYKDGSFERTTSSSGRSALAEAIRAGGNDPEKFKKNLIDSGVSEQDADYVVRSVSFSNPSSRGSRPFNTREITVGRHVFQQSPNVKLTGTIGKIDAEITEQRRLLVEGGTIPSINLGSPAGMRFHPIHNTFKMHDGNDYPLPLGTPISVIKEGEVIRSGTFGGYGEGVEIQHKDGTRSFYAHLHKRNVKVGDKVSTGTVIGTVGSTGDSTGPHLHFEYNDQNGRLVTNPTTLNSIADNTFRFGGNVRPAEVQKLAKKDGKEGYINHQGTFVEQIWTESQRNRFRQESDKKSSSKDTTLASQLITPEKARNYADELRKIKPGSGESLRIPGVGTFVEGRDIFGRPEKKYFNPDGTPMREEDFFNKVRNLSEKKKYGGLVYKNSMSPNLPEEKYASYNNPMNEPQLIIQPIMVPTLVSGSSGSNSSIIFAVPRVNSTNKSKQLMRS